MNRTYATTDPETGDRLYVTGTHWSHNFTTFVLYPKEGSPFFLGECEHLAIDETGAGGATHVKYVLRRAWKPTGIPEPPNLLYGPSEQVEQLGRLVLQWCNERPPKQLQPRYEFEDGREQYRRRTSPTKLTAMDVADALFRTVKLLWKGLNKKP